MMTGHAYTKLRESSKEVEVQWTEVFTGHMLLDAVQCAIHVLRARSLKFVDNQSLNPNA